MSDSINCNLAHCAVRHFTASHYTKTHVLPRGSMPQIVHTYNQHFTDNQPLQVKYSVGSKRFNVVALQFNNKWRRDKESCLSDIALMHGRRSSPRRGNNTVKHAKSIIQNLASAFPTPLRQGKKLIATKPPAQTAATGESPSITFTQEDLFHPPQWPAKC